VSNFETTELPVSNGLRLLAPFITMTATQTPTASPGCYATADRYFQKQTGIGFLRNTRKQRRSTMAQSNFHFLTKPMTDRKFNPTTPPIAILTYFIEGRDRLGLQFTARYKDSTAKTLFFYCPQSARLWTWDNETWFERPASDVSAKRYEKLKEFWKSHPKAIALWQGHMNRVDSFSSKVANLKK
jgi:hypothetical protein